MNINFFFADQIPLKNFISNLYMYVIYFSLSQTLKNSMFYFLFQCHFTKIPLHNNVTIKKSSLKHHTATSEKNQLIAVSDNNIRHRQGHQSH